MDRGPASAARTAAPEASNPGPDNPAFLGQFPTCAVGSGPDFRDLSAAGTAASFARRCAVGRRAADANDCTRVDSRCAHHPARRTFRGTRAADRTRSGAIRRTIVVVEQNVAAALSFADRVYILNNGHLVYEGTPGDLRPRPDVMKGHLGI